MRYKPFANIEKLKETGYDAVKITKNSQQEYVITLSNLDSYENFVAENQITKE